MKLATQWKTLTYVQRRAWNAWAKANPVLLDDGSVRRVSGHKAMTMVLRRRAAAGEQENPPTLPGEASWADGWLSVRDAGPFTVNAGFVGFRAENNVTAGLKWFVWATRPVVMGEANPRALLRFRMVMRCFTTCIRTVKSTG